MAVFRHQRLMLFRPLILLASNSEAVAQKQGHDHMSNAPDPSTFWGFASEEADGTIVIQFSVEGPNGEIGDGLKRFAPSDPDYQAVKDHVGPIPKGESVQIRPFPAERPK